MKIQKGHYVPKEFITSEAVHEAVVKCFVAAGFHRNSDYVNYREKEHWDCIAISGSGVICWSDKQETPITLQQLFTAENGLQWPDWAECIDTDGKAVWFHGLRAHKLIAGEIGGGPVIMTLATRQPKEKDHIVEADEKVDESWYESGERPPVGAECEVYNHTFGKNAEWEKCNILWRGEFLTVYSSESHHECSACNEHLEFRPVKSEREKFIDEAILVMQPNALTGTMSIWFGKLFDAGFRGPKAEK